MAQRRFCLACGETRSVLWATASDEEYFTSDQSFDFHRCVSCSSLFIDPVPKDRLGEIYPSNYYSFLPSGMKNGLVARVKDWLDRRTFRSLVRQLPGAKLSVLDVGGGMGWELGVLRESDPRVASTQIVDMDPAAAEVARGNGHQYHCGLIQEFESDRRFDLVLLLNIIEHVENPEAVLRKVRGLLNPHGLVLVKTPNYDSWDERLFRRRNWAGYHCPRHWVLFNKEGFARLAGRADFEVRWFRYTQGASFWAISLLIWLRRIGAISSHGPTIQHALFPVLAALFAFFDFVRAALGAKTSQMVFCLASGRSARG